MKVNFKAISKGVVAAGTIIGGAILALQTRAGLKEGEFAPTLEPLCSEPESDDTTDTTEEKPEEENEE